MRFFYRSDPTKREYRKRMMMIWRKLGLFEIREHRLADQTRVIRTNRWLSEVELDEIYVNSKEGENMEDPNI